LSTIVAARPRILLATAILAAIALGTWALWPTPVGAEAATARTGTVVVTVDEIGETRSHDRHLVRAPVAGHIARLALHDGDAVREGEPLLTIEPLPLGPRERDELAARLAAARALEREATQNLRHAREDLAFAQREHERLGALARRGLVPRQQADAAGTAATTAEAEAEAAHQRARAAAADVALVRAAMEARDSTPLVIRAPASGRVLRVEDASDRVVAAGELLLAIGELDRLEIVVEMLSTEAVRVRPGMPASLEGWGGDRPLRATVRLVEPYAFTKVSALGVEEQRTRVLLDFVDPPGALGDGFRVTAKIETGRAAGVTVVPSSAVFRCAEQWCVAAIERGRIARRPVQPGLRNASETAITSGLAAGASIVRYPSDAPQDGDRVVILR
jgi:HlyD family secretion protein